MRTPVTSSGAISDNDPSAPVAPRMPSALRLLCTLLFLVASYASSFGPACRLVALHKDQVLTRGYGDHPLITNTVLAMYQPLASLMVCGPYPFKLAMLWWVDMWLPARMSTFEWQLGFGWHGGKRSYTFISF